MNTMKVSRNGTISLPAEWRRSVGDPEHVGVRIDAAGNLLVFPIGVASVFGKYSNLAVSSDDIRRVRDEELDERE